MPQTKKLLHSTIACTPKEKAKSSQQPHKNKATSIIFDSKF
jgi:hypothetical protein